MMHYTTNDNRTLMIEGCKFVCGNFSTDDVETMKRLSESRHFGKNFFAVSPTPAPIFSDGDTSLPVSDKEQANDTGKPRRGRKSTCPAAH